MMYYGWLGGAPLATVRSHMNLKIIFQYHEPCIEAYVLPSGHTADCRNEFIAPTQFRTKAHTLNMRMALLAVVCHNYQHQTMCPALDNTPLGNHRGSQCHPCLSVLVSLTTASTYWCQQHHSCVNPDRWQYNKNVASAPIRGPVKCYSIRHAGIRTDTIALSAGLCGLHELVPSP